MCEALVRASSLSCTRTYDAMSIVNDQPLASTPAVAHATEQSEVVGIYFYMYLQATPAVVFALHYENPVLMFEVKIGRGCALNSHA